MVFIYESNIYIFKKTIYISLDKNKTDHPMIKKNPEIRNLLS